MFAITKLAALLDMFGGAGVPFANRNHVVDGAFEFLPTTAFALAAGPAYMGNSLYIGQCGLGGAGNVIGLPARNYPLTQSASDSGPSFFYQHNQTTACTGTLAARNLPGFWQKIEGAAHLGGRSVTLSCKLQASTPCVIPSVAGYQNFGTGGSPTPGNIIDKPVNWSVGTGWKKFSVRVDVPATSAATFGTNNNDATFLGLWFPPGFTGSINVMEFQVEYSSPYSSSDITGKGGAPTTFEYRGPQAEMARYQRFFERVSLNDNIYVPGAAASNKSYGFLVQKRGPSAVDTTNLSLGGGATWASAATGGGDMAGISINYPAAGVFFLGGYLLFDARI